MDVADRVVGCVLGLALGDALGAPFASGRADAIPDPLPAFERRRMDLPPGSTTGDTAMARNLVRSLADRGRFDPSDVMARHLEWYRTDPTRVAGFIRRVLRRVADGTPIFEAARLVWEERGPELSGDNGSVAYCAPLGAAYASRSIEIPELAGRLSALTHWDDRCRTACVAVTIAAANLVRDQPDAAAAALAEVVERPGGEELEFLVEAAGSARPVDGPDRRFCLFTAGTGLQAVVRGGDFEAELRRVVALGGDTGRNAAVAGALLGCRDGRSGLPPHWVDLLHDRPAIEREAEALAPLAIHR